MLGHIERSLARHGVDPRRLVIEITETAAISTWIARDVLRGRASLGCAVALDDFGAGSDPFST